jgi:serine/threonine protein kinase
VDHALDTAVASGTVASRSERGAISGRWDESGAETLPPLAGTWRDFQNWSHASGVAGLIEQLSPHINGDESLGTIEECLRAHNVPPSVARSLAATFFHDQQKGALTKLDRDPRVVDFAHIGSGASSDVFVGSIADAHTLSTDAPAFVQQILGGEAASQPEIVAWIQDNIRRVMDGSKLAVSKVLRDVDAKTLGRVGRELRTSLRHGKSLPIPAILGGKIDGSDVLFHMEHMPSIDVDRLVESAGLKAMPMRFVAEFAALSSRAVALTARAGLVHRDIKPANFLVGHDGRFRLLDLGFVRSLGNQSMELSAEGGTGPGTPDYIAPEIARGQVPTPAADIFSLGLVLSRMYTGGTPYRGKGGTGFSTLLEHMHLTPDKLPPELFFPPQFYEGEDAVRAERYVAMVKRMLQRMIHPDPERRPTPDEVADFFRRYSSFGNLDFEREFMNTQAHDDIRFAVDPRPEIPQGDLPLRHAYASDEDMLTALVEGAKGRSKHYDFLSSPEFGGADAPAKLSTHSRRSIAMRIGGVTALTAAGFGFLLSRDSTVTDDASALPAVVTTQGTATDSSKVSPTQSILSPEALKPPAPPKEATKLTMDAQGLPEDLRLFRNDSVHIAKDQMTPLRTSREHGNEVCGVGFRMSMDDFVRMLKLNSPEQMPESVRKYVELQENGLGGVMCSHIQTASGMKFTSIVGCGFLLETSDGLAFYANYREILEARKSEYDRCGFVPDSFKDPAFYTFLKEVPFIAEAGAIPPTWQKTMANPSAILERINKDFNFWRMSVQSPSTVAK